MKIKRYQALIAQLIEREYKVKTPTSEQLKHFTEILDQFVQPDVVVE